MASAVVLGSQAQVGQRLRVLRRARHPAGRQRVEGRDPGGERRGERLAEERPERLVLPRLDVAGRPVVEQREAEDVLDRPLGRDRAPGLGRHADDRGDLQLDVEPLGRPEEDLVPHLALARRPGHRRPRHDDRPRPPVVADRQVAPVGQQRLAAGAEQATEVRRVLERAVEVDVVGDLDREVRPGRRDRDERRLDQRPGGGVADQLGQPGPHVPPGVGPGGHEGVERGPGEQVAHRTDAAGVVGGEPRQVDDVVADAGADPGRPVTGREHAVGQVLGREPRAVGARHPRPPGGHSSPRSASAASGSSIEQVPMEASSRRAPCTRDVSAAAAGSS